MKYLQLLTIPILLSFTNNQIYAKSWKGITPLQSTRTDVESILKVKSSGTGVDELRLDSNTVYIRYVTQSCQQSEHQKWNVPIGTVISIEVIPQNRLFVRDLEFDLGKFKVSKTDVIGEKVYTDYKDGIQVGINGRTDQVGYLAYFENEKDRKLLRCPQR